MRQGMGLDKDARPCRISWPEAVEEKLIMMLNIT